MSNVKRVNGWMTSDGVIFDDQDKAEQAQNMLDLNEVFVKHDLAPGRGDMKVTFEVFELWLAGLPQGHVRRLKDYLEHKYEDWYCN